MILVSEYMVSNYVSDGESGSWPEQIQTGKRTSSSGIHESAGRWESSTREEGNSFCLFLNNIWLTNLNIGKLTTWSFGIYKILICLFLKL